MNEPIENLCPFSKPLIGQWCQCPHARLADRCSGKMICNKEAQLMNSCLDLVNQLTQKSRFILNLKAQDIELTHAQLMKIRCGGLQGMHRLLGFNQADIPDVRLLIDTISQKYAEIQYFPFEMIIKDIKDFSHRNKKRS